ncbi:MAG TPA: class I SAM-dependent methyltransferase [Candidatus Binatia bacterium]|nr:class I SAM-dependent methyltransferase [Candidatus Binatia bacterium]
MPPHDPLLNARRTGYMRRGYSAQYHTYRPKPPAALVDVLLQRADTRRPRLVVDLGSGTGISTTVWAAHAEHVIGIEPLDEMRKIAEAGNHSPNVRFQAGVAQQTGLPDGAADIATCAQSLHHTEPESTLAEVGRILRAGGVFAAYDYDVPPTVHWEAEQAFAAFIDRVRALRKRHGIRSEQQQWEKDEHVKRMRTSGVFRHLNEILLHNVEPCTAARWIGFALSVAIVLPVLDLGLSDDELGLTALREVAQRTLGDEGRPWYVSYRVRLGVK